MRAWTIEEGYTLLQALELRLSALGYHVSMIATGKARLEVLELGVYPNVKLSDYTNIRSLLHATEMQLRSIEDLDEPRTIANTIVRRVSTYEYGKGKNMRQVLVYFQDAPAELGASSTA